MHILMWQTYMNPLFYIYYLHTFCHMESVICVCVWGQRALLIIELTLFILVLVGQSRQTTFESSSFFFKWPSYQSHSFIRVYNTLLEAFGLCVHIYKFTFFASRFLLFFFFFFFCPHLLTLGDKFYCMNSVYTVHTLCIHYSRIKKY